MICGVSFDPVAENHAFRKKFEFPFALLCDTDKKLGVACGAAADASATHPKRITIVIDPDGKIAQVYDAVKPADHPQEVLNAL